MQIFPLKYLWSYFIQFLTYKKVKFQHFFSLFSPVMNDLMNAHTVTRNFVKEVVWRITLHHNMEPIPYTFATTVTKVFPSKNAFVYTFGFIQVTWFDFWALPGCKNVRIQLKSFVGEKPYKCEYCPKTFARGGQLTQHMVSHTGIRKYKCHYCPVTFSSAANMRLHMKTHLDQRDYTCHLCGKVKRHFTFKFSSVI